MRWRQDERARGYAHKPLFPAQEYMAEAWFFDSAGRVQGTAAESLPLDTLLQDFVQQASPEDFQHLSIVGVLSTIIATYTGFALLTVAVGWNANIWYKLGKIKTQWRQLRGVL